MTAFKVSKFLGKAPRISPELLPDAAAQIASNAKVSSGDLIPYRIPTIVGSVNRNGDIKTIYPMRDTSNPAINRWLSWLADVDVAVTTTLNDEEQRIYYTGDGVPKVTNYELAVVGAGAYPVGYYDLGLPLPTTIPVTTATSYTSQAITSYARDSGNTATIVTSGNHDLNTGQKVTIAGYTSDVGKVFNITNAQVTVIDDTTFTYYSVGAAVGTSSESGGTANLAGNTNTRNYIYTWVTPWGEESVPSDLSETLYVKEGQTITISNLPTAAPAGNNFITGFRLYRTITSSSGSDYFRVRTVWFPISLVQASRTSGTVTMKVSEHHNLLVGDKIKISGTAFGGTLDATFDVTDVTVQSVVDDYTFTYIAGVTNKATTGCTGTLYWDVSEPETTDSRYYEGSTFTDDYDVNGLTTLLSSLYYDAPDANMKGLITAQNNILVGFVGNELCFSEPGKPWAWPIKYRLIFDSPIVAISPIAGSIIVLTNSYPHLVSGSTPANMASARIDAPFPCTSKRGVVNVGYGVVFPTYGGLGIYNPSAGIDIVTKLVYDWEAWGTDLDSTTITASFYAGKYFASHSAGSFIFEREDKVGGFFIDVPIEFSAAYYDSEYNKFYYISDQSGTLSEWDKLGTGLLPLEWKSKVIVTKDYINLGAARVVGDYSTPSEDTEIIVANNLLVPAINTALFALVTQLGTLNGPTSATLTTSGALNTMQVNGDPFFTQDIAAAYAQNITPTATPIFTTVLKEVTGSYPVSFRLWANKQLVCDVTVSNSDIFRLPPGYRADTFEFAVAGSARIRAIHIGETPFGLRTT